MMLHNVLLMQEKKARSRVKSLQIHHTKKKKGIGHTSNSYSKSFFFFT